MAEAESGRRHRRHDVLAMHQAVGHLAQRVARYEIGAAGAWHAEGVDGPCAMSFGRRAFGREHGKRRAKAVADEK